MSFSAEPGRKAPYACDLRWRIVWQRFGKGLGYKEIAENLNISLGTAYNICRLFEDTGSVDARPSTDLSRLLSDHQELWVIGLVLDNCSLQLGEICQKVHQVFQIQVSPSTICRLLYRHGFTRRKIQQVAQQRSSNYRGKFMATMLMFDADKIVWIDETGCDRRDQIRRLGYSIRGERPVCHRLLQRGQRISIIAAMTTEGIISTEIVKGTVNGSTFTDFIQGKLIPEMMQFNGENSRSIAVLDNCSVHHVSEIEASFQQAGILLYYLPPYSPDLNPVEEMFSYFKYYLKYHDDVLQCMDDPVPLIEDALDSVTPQQCIQWIKHSGYTCSSD